LAPIRAIADEAAIIVLRLIELIYAHFPGIVVGYCGNLSTEQKRVSVTGCRGRAVDGLPFKEILCSLRCGMAARKYGPGTLLGPRRHRATRLVLALKVAKIRVP
jgi:hypothetical protein